MNPEDNNPLSNTGASGASSSMPDPIQGLGGTPSNSTSSSTTGSSTTGSTDTSSAVPENPFASIKEEPPVPAAPVPGSIGSVISVPPAPSADSMGSPFGTTADSPASSTSSPFSTAPSMSSAASEPTVSSPLPAPETSKPQPAAPYNPFAPSASTSTYAGTTSTSASPAAPASSAPASNPFGTTSSSSTSAGFDSLNSTVSTSSSTPGAMPGSASAMPGFGAAPSSAPTMAPPVQPTKAPKTAKTPKAAGAKGGHTTLLLAIVAVIAVVAAVVFAVLYFKELNNVKPVYVPSVSEGKSDATVSILSCTHPVDYSYLIGYDHPVEGVGSVTVTYTGDNPTSIAFDASATFDNESDANVARDNFVNSFATRDVLVGNHSVNGSAVLINYELAENSDLSADNARAFIYGEGAADQDLSLAAVEDHYKTAGYSCTTE